MSKLSQELIAKIREEIKEGKSRYDVADEVGISVGTVYRYTADMPKRRLKKLSKEDKNKIREKIMQGISIYELAKEYDVNPHTVYMAARSLIHSKPSTSGNFCIRGRALEILHIHKEEFYMPKKGETMRSSFYTLCKYFPIKKVVIKKGQSIYFLEGKDDIALRAFMKRRCFKTIGYHELCSITPLFGVNISPKEKRDIIGKNDPEKDDSFKNVKLKKQEFQSEQPQNFNDFGSFLL